MISLASTSLSVLLALVLAASAYCKLTRHQLTIESVRRVGFPESKLPLLAALLLAGAAGLSVGLWWPPLGIAASCGVICYFLVTVGFHVRARDTAHLPAPLGFLVLATATLALQLAR